MQVLARSWWAGSPAPGRALRGPLSHVVVHHSASSSSYADQDAEADELRAVERYHRDVNGWDGLAYSFVVFPSGRAWEGRGWGRSGAHTRGHNDTAVGLCLAGNGETEPATPEAWAAAAALIEQGIRQDHLTPQPRVTGHRDHAATACPGAHNQDRLHLLQDIDGIGQEDDMLTDRDLDAIEGMIRRILGDAVGPGQRTWAGTVRATLDGLQQTYNVTDSTARRLGAVEAELQAVRQLLDGSAEGDAGQTMVLPRPEQS